MEGVFSGLAKLFGGNDDTSDSHILTFGSSLAHKAVSAAANNKTYDHLFKILLIGDHGVGKSCLLVRFADDNFFGNSYISTIGVDFKIRTIRIGESIVKLQLWDTSGQERFRTISSSYYRGANGVMILFSVNDRSSFDSVQRWINEIKRYSADAAQRILVATKCDVPASERQVLREEGEELADSLELTYVETSAKENINVEEAFTSIAIQIAESLEMGTSSASEPKKPLVVNTRAEERKVVIETENDDAESFSEEELAGDLKSAAVRETKEKIGKKKGKKVKASKADVNVFKLDLTLLGKEVAISTGDPVRCCSCGAMLNLYSNVMEVTEDKLREMIEQRKNQSSLELAPAIHARFESCIAQPIVNSPDVSSTTTTTTTTTTATSSSPVEGTLWCCEFCDHLNLIDLVPEEVEQIATKAMVDFLVKQPDQNEASVSTPMVLFCIDVSGSMCVTTEVEGNVELMGAEKRQRINRELAAAQGGGQQWMPGQRRNVTHVSRLQCVQAAVANQIEHLCATSPQTPVALVTFSDEVHLLGDGSQEEVVVSGDKLDSWDTLKEIGKAFKVTRSVQEAKKDLLEKLWGLEEGGQTALGPALQLSLVVGSNREGSSVVLCTDGLANKGVGSLESYGVEGEEVEAKLFYTELGEQARVYGLTCSIISIIGTECRLEALSAVTEQSRGKVERVAATQLQNELSAIVDKPVVAYTCMAMVCLPHVLHFKGEMDDELERRNWLVKDLGTVHKGDECTFSYGFRNVETNAERIPFQVQVLHRRLDGSEVLRVATAQIQMTTDRAEAEKHADVKVVATHAAQRAAAKAKTGDYRAAQLEIRSAQRLMQRAGNVEEQDVAAWTDNVESMDRMLREGEDGGIRSDDTAQNISKFAQINAMDLF